MNNNNNEAHSYIANQLSELNNRITILEQKVNHFNEYKTIRPRWQKIVCYILLIVNAAIINFVLKPTTFLWYFISFLLLLLPIVGLIYYSTDYIATKKDL